MKSLLILGALALAAVPAFSAQTAAAPTAKAPAAMTLGAKHAKMGVKADADGNGPKMKMCLGCHGGSYAALAKKTEAVKPNPHFNHFGDRDCQTCHKWSTKPVLTCDECHKFTTLKMPLAAK